MKKEIDIANKAITVAKAAKAIADDNSGDGLSGETAKALLDTIGVIPVNTAPELQGGVIDGAKKIVDLKVDRKKMLEDMDEQLFGGNNNSDRSLPKDPLVLDLNGDGIHFTSLEESNAQFDLNGNGFATNNSWLNADDGFLVMDKNRDGVINDISELFGSPERTGYEELADLDSNKDGIIDESDERFAELQVWQDSNGDGVSQADELRSLSEVGIASVSLAHVAVEGGQGDAQLARQGTFEWENGEAGVAGGATGIAADVLFTSDPTLSTYVGEVTHDTAVEVVANIKGLGVVADLHIAMSLDNATQSEMISLINGGSIASIANNIDQILVAWAGVENIQLSAIDPDSGLAADEQGNVTFSRAGVALSVEQLGVLKSFSGLDILNIGDGQWREDGVVKSTGEAYRNAYATLARNTLVNIVVANGLLSDILPDAVYDFESGATQLIDSELIGFLIDVEAAEPTFSANDYVAAIYYEYYEQIVGFMGEANGDKASIDTLLVAAMAVMETSLFDTEDLFIYAISEIEDFEALLPIFESELINLIPSLSSPTVGSDVDDVIVADSGNNIIVGLDGADSLNGGAGDDIIYGNSGSDTLDGEGGNDVLYGGEGDDHIIDNSGRNRLFGGEGSDALTGLGELFGGAGNDILTAYAFGNNTLDGGAGNDTLTTSQITSSSRAYQNSYRGGKGNDTLTGGYSADTYHYALGDGHDVITDTGYGSNQSSSYHRADTLVLAADITAEMVTFSHTMAGDIVMQIIDPDNAANNGSITLKGAYSSNVANRIEEVIFLSDATGASDLNESEIQVLAINNAAASDLDDRLMGTIGDDVVHGGQGHDLLFGQAGNDRLEGGAGNDTLTGDAGADLLIGDSMTETVEGGSDTYLFAEGDGADVIFNHDDSVDSIDTAVFEEASLHDLWFSRADDNLQINRVGSDDSVEVSRWFEDESFELDQIEVDGAVLLNNQVDLLVNAMAAFEAPDGVGDVVPQEVKDELQVALAEAWQVS
ncbi:hemolysin type calcium-binding protein [Sinobacterium caligoides]|uniref:Hemolysin type calcium-binding protein n=1 Tax=Sinobacterium caligoides TaxID=933926 RepID=A0A3N2E0I2_9GAMM|nr:calcium-binding protein [Sinobacterium caligoides]ROS05075.1 hemolysin type calcium-binding protein [Sinobacterium caligoides]